MKFSYSPLFPEARDRTRYLRLTAEYVREVKSRKKKILEVKPEALRIVAREAFSRVNFYFRTSHLENLASILDDPESSANDRFVAAALLKNAIISAEGVLPLCQDSGTANIFGFKGEKVLTGADDARWLSRGVFEAYTGLNLRASQMAPLSMLEDVNTGTNLPAQVEIFSTPGCEYRFLFIAKGAGSSNRTALYQENKSLLRDEQTLMDFLRDKIMAIGVDACPPYRMAVVIGGLSAELNLRAVKLATAGWLDNLVTNPSGLPQGYRDLKWEEKVLKIARKTGLGAQFGGAALAVEARVIRLPRHSGSLPLGIGVSCSADRNIRAGINRNGIFIEALEMNPARFLKKIETLGFEKVPEINLDQSVDDLISELSKFPVGTRLSLSGTLIVARDTAHLKLKKMLDKGEPLPDYFKRHPVYYAGPARTPEGMAAGSFGPTTARRMDAYVEELMKAGASRIMIAKGGRSLNVVEACRKYGGFYLGTIGGAAALVAKEHIVSSEPVDFEDLGMEAVRKIVVRNLPAIVIFDNKGNRLY